MKTAILQTFLISTGGNYACAAGVKEAHMPRENNIVAGANNSAYAELAGQGAGGSSLIESESPSIGRQEGQATIRTRPELDAEIQAANLDRPAEGPRDDDALVGDRDHNANPNAYRDNYVKENSF